MMRQITMGDHGHRVTEYGHGTTYHIQAGAGDTGFILQGKEAVRFRTEVMEAPEPAKAFYEGGWNVPTDI